MKYVFLTALAMTVFFGSGCISPLYLHEGEFTGRSAQHQEALYKALYGSIIKLLPRPEKDKDPEQTVKPKTPPADIRKKLKGRKIFLDVAVLARGQKQEDSCQDVLFIRSVFEQFFLQHMEVRIVPREQADVVVTANVYSFGVNVDASVFPFTYLPVFSSLTVTATVKIHVFGYIRESQLAVFNKRISDDVRYKRYNLFGFPF